MDETEWNMSTDAVVMLDFVRHLGLLSERKLRLFACACVRRQWHDLSDERCTNAVAVAERFADGLASPTELKLAADTAWEVVDQGPRLRTADTDAALCATATLSAMTSAEESTRYVRGLRDAVAVIHDIFGNPFRPPVLSASLSTWKGGAILTTAQRIYDRSEFEFLPFLADLLQEAGCQDAGVLAHLRSPGPHVRGCWVLDLVLGKT